MGKKGSWFSTIKSLCTSKSKHKQPLNDGERNKGRAGAKRGSFIPLFRKTSSIEDILGDIDQHNLYIGHYPPTQPQPQPQPIQTESQQVPETQSQPTPPQRQPEPTQPQRQPEPQPQQQQHKQPIQPESQRQPEPQQHQQPIQPESQQQPQTTQPQRQPEPRPTQPQRQPEPRPTQPQRQPEPQHQQPQPIQPKSQQQPQPTQPQRQQEPRPTKPQLEPQARPAKPQRQPSSSSRKPVESPQKLTSPPRVVDRHDEISHTPESTLQQHHLSASKIQAAYRSHKARRSLRGSTGLVRLQRVLESKNVKRQTVNAMKQMQLLVRVQTQIRASRRIQMLKTQALKPQPSNNNSHKQSETSDEFWDDSSITKEERQARMKRKEIAVINRERAKAYAYSHKSSTSAHQPDEIPWWWKWLEHKMPYNVTPNPPPIKIHQFAATSSSSTPQKQLDSPMSITSTRSTNRLIKYSRARKGPFSYSMKDDDSLMSCPPFSVPNYMSPTVSARAKARPTSNPKERSVAPSTPGSVTSARRFSFPFTPNTNSPGSVGHMSTASVPVSLGRKPFNRFV